jgi:hypothetical protein
LSAVLRRVRDGEGWLGCCIRPDEVCSGHGAHLHRWGALGLRWTRWLLCLAVDRATSRFAQRAISRYVLDGGPSRGALPWLAQHRTRRHIRTHEPNCLLDDTVKGEPVNDPR